MRVPGLHAPAAVDGLMSSRVRSVGAPAIERSNPMSSGTRTDISRFFRHSVIYTVGSALNRVGAFVLLPLYTNYLSPAQYGILEILYAVSAIVSGVLSVGIAHAALRFYFDYESERDRHSVISSNLHASFGISVVGVGLAWAVGQPLVAMALGSETPRWGYALILVTVVLELSSQICLAYLRAVEKSMFFVGVVLGKLLVQCVANTYLVATLGAGVDGVLGGNCLAVAAGWLVLVVYTVRQCGWRFESEKVLPVLRYSLPFLYTTIVSVIVANLDRFIIGKLLSLEALGLYALAGRFGKLIADLVGEPFARSYGAFRFTVMNRPDAGAIQAQVVRLVSCLLAVISLGLIFFTIDVLRWMSSPTFWPAARLLPLLAFASSVTTLTYAFQTGVLVRKQTGELFRVSLIQNGIGLVSGIVLMVAFGVVGACVAVVLHALVGAWLTHRASQKYFPVVYDWTKLMLLCGFTVLAYGLSLPLEYLGHGTAFVGKLLILAAFVVVVARSRVLTPQERAMLVDRLSMLRERMLSRT
ncbi:MAG: hypothetical protein E6Q93_11480 [Burkholderiaceae bacterium]|nr:MAG: hypothetical protein E6Q93_11480 [Burkholderiaceae bacterium]